MEILTTILKKKKMKYEKDVQCFYCEKDIKLKDAYLDEDEKIVCEACGVHHQS